MLDLDAHDTRCSPRKMGPAILYTRKPHVSETHHM